MRILTLLGSPRKRGNTNAVLHRFEARAVEQGHTVTRIDVIDYTVAGCLGCDACQGDLTGFGCVQADDAENILEQIRAADLTVYAAPVYCWSVPAQLKAVIDRHYCTVKWEAGEVVARLLAGKRAALLLTCGDNAATNVDLTLPMFQREMDYIGMTIAGMYALDNCTTPLADTERAALLAQQMASELLK